MKKILILSSLFITQLALADWVKQSDFNSCETIGYYDQSTCQKSTQETCLKRPENNCEVFKLTDVFIADTTKPIYYEYGHFTCTNNEESSEYPQCSLSPDFECSQGGEVVSEFEDQNMTRFCKRQDGYEQKFSHKIIEVDQALKTAKDLAKAQAQAQENALKMAEKSIDCGKHAQKVLLLRNAPKQLTTAQIKQMVATYSDIKQLLDTGSLVSAKEEIAKTEADGVLITNDDKTALINAIDNCMGQ